MLKIVLVLLYSWKSSCGSAIVTVEQGQLRGQIKSDYRGANYFSFQGVPYAKPPVGELRFKPPQPPVPWGEAYDATEEKSSCYSAHGKTPQDSPSSEDCLFLNIFSRNLTGAQPVMFFVHGEGPHSGSSTSDFYSPDFLLEEGVLLVTLNYRLGILGLIEFKDPALGIPGNAGYKDLVMGLSWVQKNIGSFGGDPGSVTVFGQNTGAVAVHLLFVSSLARGLFHKVIVQSAPAVDFWAPGFQNTPEILKILGLKNEQELHESLKDLPPQDLIKLQSKLSPKEPLPAFPKLFGYVIEEPSNQAFLTEHPRLSVLNGHFTPVPFMMGTNAGDGAVFELLLGHENYVNLDFEKCIPYTFGLKLGSPESQSLAEDMKQFYLENAAFDGLMAATNLLTDSGFLYYAYQSVLQQSQKSQQACYMYNVALTTKLNLQKNLNSFLYNGSVHFDDLGYLFKTIATPKTSPNTPEDLARARFVKMWTNFAKYGDPTPEQSGVISVQWAPVTPGKFTVLNIGGDLQAMSPHPDIKRLHYLDDLVGTYKKNRHL